MLIIVFSVLVLIWLSLPSYLAPDLLQPDVKQQTISACIDLCKDISARAGVDLGNGPCLADPLSEFPDWVCDIAHDPRETIDDLPENQCSVYREGKAKHFVEVDYICNLIRAM